MNRIYLLVITALFFITISSAQTTYYVMNEVGNEPLSNVLVYYGENSIYSNAEGAFQLPEEFKDGEIVLDGLGYQLKTIAISNIESYKIYLTKETQFLETVVLKGDPIKVRNIKQKPSKKKSWIHGVPHHHGQELGILIAKGESNTEVRLKSLVIPIIKKNADWEQMRDLEKRKPNKKSYPLKNKKLGTRFLFRIQFYEMADDSTFKRLQYPVKDFVVQLNQYKYEIDYSNEEVLFPENGLLISVLNMGPCDEDGNMLSIPRFKFREIDGKKRKLINNIYDIPLIALHPRKKAGVKDFFHARYSENSRWSEVSDKKFPRIVGGPLKQLGLGYELEVRYYD